jgi:anthranilate synthase component 1
MDVVPDYESFTATFERHQPQLLWTTLVADLDTPVSAMLKLARDLPNSFLLESVEGGAFRGRYSFIGLKPDLIWRCFGDRAEINRRALDDPDAFAPCPAGQTSGALESLRRLMAEIRFPIPPGLPPMAAGLVGYLGYDMVRLMERLPHPPGGGLGLPDGLLLRPTVIAIFDNVEDKVTVLTPVWPGDGVPAQTAYDQALGRLGQAVADFDRSPPGHHTARTRPLDRIEPRSTMAAAAYHDLVARAKDYIFAGDILQTVLSQRFQAPFVLPPFTLYRALRRLNPSPFLFFFNFEGFAVVGSSPEIMVRVRDGTVTIRPIAGTRRRGASPEEDSQLATELLADPKERAEHLMLLDLGRNDVGRVARIGTVKVTEQMVIERYSHVMHIVSNVEGLLDPRFEAIDALIAAFPAGTVSGAPKVRAMEIIDELEPERRGVYGGCIGYLSANGELDTCIALRTAVIKDGVLYVQAGGGVVADSRPEAEEEECRNKAQALFRAAEEAIQFSEEG